MFKSRTAILSIAVFFVVRRSFRQPENIVVLGQNHTALARLAVLFILSQAFALSAFALKRL
ncbi:MAG: hypothetical protein IKH45_01295 [Neisseriaceae bacterium]|nr:hypothetical protein [Neisseriaceae bacterium]